MAYKILIFGGTTEGLKVARLLDALGEPYIYSTKTQTKQQVAGERLEGAVTAETLVDIVRERGVKLIIDAAHPFAVNLHQMLIDVSAKLELCTVRYHRVFPDMEEACITTFDSYEAMQAEVIKRNYNHVLALTGVQTIPKLKQLWDRQILFRILATNKSLALAKETGIPLSQIHQEEPSDSVSAITKLAKRIEAQVVLSKESGKSGFFESKVEAAQILGIPLFVVKRPELQGYTYDVDSDKSLHQLLLRLRRSDVLKAETLRHGYTTGSCLTAAAQAAFTALMTDETKTQELVEIACGEKVTFLTYEQERSSDHATYITVKNGGDDPDVTHAKEIGCTLTLTPQAGLKFKQGPGVGRVTLPGLQTPVGDPAINPVPRQMIKLMIEHLSAQYDYTGGVELTAFVPEGQEIAKNTFNPRVGVVDGISIIGTTGKVMPYSSEAFVGAISKQLQVAHECCNDAVLATSGLRSEKRLIPLLANNTYTAVHFGNFIGETLQLCQKYEFPKIMLGIMLGKAVKLAQGQLDTHSKHTTFNKEFILDLLRETQYPDDILEKVGGIMLANELTAIIPFVSGEPFYERIAQLCHSHCQKLIPEPTQLTLYLLSAGHDGMIVAN